MDSATFMKHIGWIDDKKYGEMMSHYPRNQTRTVNYKYDSGNRMNKPTYRQNQYVRKQYGNNAKYFYK